MGKQENERASFERGVTDEKIFLLITAVIAVFTLIYVMSAWSDILFFPGSLVAPGTITACDIQQSRIGTSCLATIRFETQAQQSVIFHASAGDSQTGDTVMVRYHLNDSGNARIDGFQGGLTFAGIWLGVLLLDLGIFWYWRRRRAREYRRIHKGLAKNSVLQSKKWKKLAKRRDRYTRG